MSLPTELPLLCGINKVLWGPSGRKTKTHYTVYAEPRGLEEISEPAEGWCHFMAGMTFLECTAPLNENERGHGSPSAYREAVTIMRTDSSRDLDACISFPTFLFQCIGVAMGSSLGVAFTAQARADAERECATDY